MFAKKQFIFQNRWYPEFYNPKMSRSVPLINKQIPDGVMLVGDMICEL